MYVVSGLYSSLSDYRTRPLALRNISQRMQSTTSLGSNKSGVSRDIQHELMSKGRKRLRDVGYKKWSLPYPLVRTDEAVL